MTKAQRARLAALHALATRTAAEDAELVSLKTLATAHPDTSKDTDAPAAAAPAAASPAAPANSPASGESPAGLAQPPAPAGLAGILQTAFASVRSRVAVSADLTTARAHVATVTAERDTARTDLAAARSQLSALSSQLSAMAGFFGLKPEQLAGLDAAAATALVSRRIADTATEQVAALGFNVTAVPPTAPGNGGSAADTLEEVQSEMAGCKDPVALGKLAAKANALREKAWANPGKN
jgi:hypothetical protein